jgi:peptidyl-prolyl cis-trans isomerase B (cyclophilin B)
MAGIWVLCSACGGNTEESGPEQAPGKTGTKTQQAAPAQVLEALTDENAEAKLLAYGKENPENRAIMVTPMGTLKIKLYEDTPLHRANFVRLAKAGYFENTLFYRVIKDFVVQGGDSDELEQMSKKRKLGKYKVPAEFIKTHIHKKGALAAARHYEDNPLKKSTPYDFYFVHGTTYTPEALKGLAKELNKPFDSNQQQWYTTVGGTPNLDGEHTVFGEVIEGLDVIDRIAALEVGPGDWPLEKVTISVKVLYEN